MGPAQLSAEELAFREREGTTAPNMQLAIAHAPEVARCQLELTRAAAAGIPLRQKELIILLVGLLTDNAYCWGHHVPPALSAGLTEAEIIGIRAGDHSMLPPNEQMLLRYCAAVVDQAVTDELWDAASQNRTPEEMVKVTMLVGFYCMLGKVQAALQIQQDEGFGGFEEP